LSIIASRYFPTIDSLIQEYLTPHILSLQRQQLSESFLYDASEISYEWDNNIPEPTDIIESGYLEDNYERYQICLKALLQPLQREDVMQIWTVNILVIVSPTQLTFGICLISALQIYYKDINESDNDSWNTDKIDELQEPDLSTWNFDYSPNSSHLSNSSSSAVSKLNNTDDLFSEIIQLGSRGNKETAEQVKYRLEFEEYPKTALDGVACIYNIAGMDLKKEYDRYERKERHNRM
ncbi:5413_t:CDS:2, partial [Racocetra persica]